MPFDICNPREWGDTIQVHKYFNLNALYVLYLARWKNNSVPHGRCFVFGSLLFKNSILGRLFGRLFIHTLPDVSDLCGTVSYPSLLGPGTWITRFC